MSVSGLTGDALVAGVFVYDGLLYASQAFAFVRSQMLLGLVFVFLPALAINMHFLHSLAAIWIAKACLNAWRMSTAAYHVHVHFLTPPSREISPRHSALAQTL